MYSVPYIILGQWVIYLKIIGIEKYTKRLNIRNSFETYTHTYETFFKKTLDILYTLAGVFVARTWRYLTYAVSEIFICYVNTRQNDA